MRGDGGRGVGGWVGGGQGLWRWVTYIINVGSTQHLLRTQSFALANDRVMSLCGQGHV